MEYVLHLTDNCNLNCQYCYENKQDKELSFQNITQLIDFEIKQKNKTAVIQFYGGEPLLKKQLIRDSINYIKMKNTKTKFYFGITTNGTLIDNEWITYMKKNNFVSIGYSIDGKSETQNKNRRTKNGEETFTIVEENAKKILENFNIVVAMMVVTKNNIKNLSENINYLIELGFRSINMQFNYLDDWQDQDLSEIKKQYKQVADIYAKAIQNEVNIDIPIIDEKIKTYIQPKYNCNQDCQLGIKTIHIGTDGNFYPCVQFVNHKEFRIGNCQQGINVKARKKVIENAKQENELCKSCLINKRCKHTCACRNYRITNAINEVSPLICETEKIFIDIADQMAEELYHQNSNLFMQKQYNQNYQLIKQLINRKGMKKNGTKKCDIGKTS